MTDEGIKACLDAIRAQIDALEVLLLSRQTVDETTGPCPHPEDKRESNPVSGAPRQFLCRACLQLINPDAQNGQE